MSEGGIDFDNVVSDLERDLIMQSLRKTSGNKKMAARLLNLKRTTLIEKMKRVRLDVLRSCGCCSRILERRSFRPNSP
jgi:DNA-binding NtrC family response regulator